MQEREALSALKEGMGFCSFSVSSAHEHLCARAHTQETSAAEKISFWMT